MSPAQSSNKTEDQRHGRWRVWLGATVVALVAYGASGFYAVQPNERGVVRWFGWLPDSQKRVPPGVHYALPWPCCRVDKPRTTDVRRVFVGLDPEARKAIARGDRAAMVASPASDVLTGDVNILKVSMVVQYQVVDAAAYLFATAGPDRLVEVTVQGVLVDELASLPVDNALTAGKAAFQERTRRRSQALLDQYGCGIHLISTQLEAIEPPRAIIDAFKDVVSAKKDGEKTIDEAVAEANTVLSQARGKAADVRERAEAYRVGRIHRAHGEADRFLSLLAEYKKAPEVTADRLRLDAFERVLPSVRVYVLDNDPDGKPANLRIIDSAAR